MLNILWPPDAKSWLIWPWCWERLREGGEGDDRGWDDWMASPTQWTWVWVGYVSWWWTGRPGMLQFMGSQRVGHDWATELNWTHGWYTRKCVEFPRNLTTTVEMKKLQPWAPDCKSVFCQVTFIWHQSFLNSIEVLIRGGMNREDTHMMVIHFSLIKR